MFVPHSLVLLLICLISVDAIANRNGSTRIDPPMIHLDHVGMQWSNITRSDGTILLYSIPGDDLVVICKALYAVTWNISGIIRPPEIAKLFPPQRNLLDGTFEIKVEFFYVDANTFSEMMSSADLICQKVGQPEIQSKVSVFVSGFNNKPVIAATRTNVINSKFIPCYTTEPTNLPTLYLSLPNNNEQRVDNVIYNPTEGFYSTGDMFDGNYVCRKGSHSVRISAVVTEGASPNSEVQFSPSTREVKVFAEESITFKCSSNARMVVLEFSKNEDVTVDFVQKGSNVQEAVVFPSTGIQTGSNETIRGKASCFQIDESRRKRLVVAWDYEFLATPELYLDNFEGEVDCISQFSPKVMQTVRCKNSMDCQFMSRCLKNGTDCNFKRQKQFFGRTDTSCFIEELGSGRDCASVPYYHLNGVAQCTIHGLTKTWNYFVSLDFLKYNDWNKAQQELVRMDEIPNVLYTNQSTEFICTAVAFLFANSLTFELEVENGTRTILEQNDDTINVTILNSDSRRKIDEFNILARLDIYLPIDAVAVHCKAPWWNGSEVEEASRKFETRHLLTPMIQGESVESDELFYTNDKIHRLTCLATGEPQPTYQWEFRPKDGDEFEDALMRFTDLKTSLGSRGEGYLDFSTPDIMYTGQYRCIAKNTVNKTEKVFKLEVSDPPVSGKSVAYVITVLVILVILGLVLGALIIFMRRYKDAKELVRTLTDSEIDEFFQGKPELLGNAEGFGQIEVIDFLPYKNEYEISLDDIEFDQSPKNFLGSGEFSYVVKGRIISRQKPVAVKISKPTADVTLFKSLLSEVKIMIYIGDHENVVTLVGVCTQSIRNRSIHIATEICDLGSVDGYLRKARPDFINLIDSNQQIEKTLLPEGDTNTSTYDLLSFSAQIAKGMEYLAYKHVVHADLAARNVLLTSDKVAKISDFGLSKKLYECNNYVKKSKSPLPWRWMPPESLNTLTFSTQSDVWSYGATLYEIFTLGDIPFPNEEWNKEFLTRLASGMRMGRPKYSTPDIYSKIIACWENESDHRPNFTTLRTYFEQMLIQHGGASYIAPRYSTIVPTRKMTEPSVQAPVLLPLYTNCDNLDPSSSSPTQAHHLDSASHQYVNCGPEDHAPNYINLEES